MSYTSRVKPSANTAPKSRLRSNNNNAISTTGAASATARRRVSDGPPRNPLIDDLFDEISSHGLNGSSRLYGGSGSSRDSFPGLNAAVGSGRRRPSTANSCSFGNGTSEMQSKLATDTICTTASRYVHAMRMHGLGEFMAPCNDATPEEVLRRQLRKKTPQEVEMVVLMLAELLEDVRSVRDQVATLKGMPELLEGRERALSSSVFSTVSTASMMRPPVHETNQVATSFDHQGKRMINSYTVIANLGQGAYGKVKLGVDVSSGQNVAIKIIDKKHLKKRVGVLGSKDDDNGLKREIAIMKKVRHRNCVSLYEVIDDPASNKLYLIMDYVPNGPVVRLKPQQFSLAAFTAIEADKPVNGVLYDKYFLRCAVRQLVTPGEQAPLTTAEMKSTPTVFACKPVRQHVCALYLRQLVSGLRYMHKRHLVHHDIKPDNILLGSDHHVFLTDFGVSEILSVRSDGRKDPSGSSVSDANNSLDSNTSDENGAHASDNRHYAGNGAKLGAGTLLFSSPELFDSTVDQSTVDPYLTDVWALGATLYCMLVGTTPFFGNSIAEVRRSILTQSYPWNGNNLYSVPLAPEWREVLDGLLAKDPTQRWTLEKLKVFLDEDDFQETMRLSALHEASRRTGSRMQLNISSSLSLSSSPANQDSDSQQPPSTSLPGRAASVFSRSNRKLSGSVAGSVLSIDSPSNRGSPFSWFTLSQADVSRATRAATVEVTVQKVRVSAATRAVVRRYVQRVRQKLRDNNYIPMSGDPSMRASALLAGHGASKPFDTTSNNGKAARTGTSSPAAASPRTAAAPVPIIPVLPDGWPAQRVTVPPSNSAAAEAPASAPKSPPQWESRVSNGRRTRGNRTSVSVPESTIARKVLNCRSESLDTFLSIVNLPSTTHRFSQSTSFGADSSSSSNPGGTGVPSGVAVAVTAAPTLREPLLADGPLADVRSSKSTHNTAAMSSMGETAVWMSAAPPPSIESDTFLRTACLTANDENAPQSGTKGEACRPLPTVVRCKPRPKQTYYKVDVTKARSETSSCTASADVSTYTAEGKADAVDFANTRLPDDMSTSTPSRASPSSKVMENFLLVPATAPRNQFLAGSPSTQPPQRQTQSQMPARPPLLPKLQAPPPELHSPPSPEKQQQLSSLKSRPPALQSCEQVPAVHSSRSFTSRARKTRSFKGKEVQLPTS